MLRTISRGEIYRLDPQKLAQFSVPSGGTVLLPPAPSTPADSAEPRMDWTHPTLLVQSSELSGQREFAIGAMVTTNQSAIERAQGKGWAVVLSPDEVEAEDPEDQQRWRLVKCNQIYTFRTDFFLRRVGKVRSEGMTRVTQALAKVIGLRDS